MPELLYLILAGIIGGFIAGFMGVGGGIIYIVILPIALEKILIVDNEILAAMIVANSFLGICVASITAILTHLSAKTFYWKPTAWVAIPAFLVAMIVQQLILQNAQYNYFVYNILVIIVLFGVLSYYLHTHFSKKAEHKNEYVDLTPIKLGTLGIFAGLVSVFTGLGGAVVLIPLLKFWLNVDIKKARSISIGMIFLVSFYISFSNLWSVNACAACTGLISWEVSVPIILGVLLSSMIGVKISHRLPKKYIERSFVVFLTLVLIQKAFLILKNIE